MKGLFVTPSGTTSGPQITSTVKGNKVNLHVRVYNYSLANFPAGSTIHVQFYAQPWGTGEFASVAGQPNVFQPAVFIGEGTDSSGNPLTPVPPFCGGYSGGADPCVGSSIRNWEFAYATWDTSSTSVPANSNWKFWVVAWVENNGTMVTELLGHGLSKMPTAQFNSLGDVPIETYSNNLGYYNQVFTILAPSSLASTARTKIKPSLIVSNVGLRNDGKALRDTPSTITTKLRSTGAEIRSAVAYYYDGDPGAGGTLFEMQSINSIPSGNGFTDTASFTPKNCGPHWIYVRAVPVDGSIRPTTMMKGINVTIDPLSETESLVSFVQAMTAPVSLKQKLLNPLLAAKDAYQSGRLIPGNIQLEAFKIAVQISREEIPQQTLIALQDELKDIQGCLR